MTNEELEYILSQNEILKDSVDKITEIFKKYCFLTEKEIKNEIKEIIARNDEEVAFDLACFYEKYVSYEIKDVAPEARRKFAEIALSKTTEIYLKDRAKIEKEFFELLDIAKANNIDPFALALKSNLKTPSAKRFQESLEALMHRDYYNHNDFKHSYKLFNAKETKEFFENCASSICKINEDNVQEIIYLLSEFFYDPATKRYVVSPKQAIKQVNSLILENPEKLARTMDFLYNNFTNSKFTSFPMSKKELALRVAKAPSILLIQPETILTFNNKLQENIETILTHPTFQNTDLLKDPEFVERKAREISFDLDRLTSITSIRECDLKNMDNITHILIKHFGANNALNCFSDMNFLSIEPTVLDALIYKLKLEEKKTKIPYSKFLIENPARAINVIRSGGSIKEVASSLTGNKNKQASSEKHTLSQKKKVKAEEYSNNVTESDLEKALCKLTDKNKNKVNSIIDNIKVQYVESIDEKVLEELEKIAPNNNEYLDIINRLEIALDTKNGEGYCEKKYSLSNVRKQFKQFEKNCEFDLDKFVNDYNELTQDYRLAGGILREIQDQRKQSEQNKSILFMHNDGLYFVSKNHSKEENYAAVRINNKAIQMQKEYTNAQVKNASDKITIFAKTMANMQEETYYTFPKIKDQIMPEDMLEDFNSQTNPYVRKYLLEFLVQDLLVTLSQGLFPRFKQACQTDKKLYYISPKFALAINLDDELKSFADKLKIEKLADEQEIKAYAEKLGLKDENGNKITKVDFLSTNFHVYGGLLDELNRPKKSKKHHIKTGDDK